LRTLFYELGYLFTLGSKWRALFSFFLSLISAIAQISAFVMIAIFIRLLENDHNVNFFGWDIPVGEKTLKGFALAIPFALVLSLIFKLYTVIWITREGQKFFDYLAEFTFDLGKELQLSHGTFNSGDISSMIKYDVRYAAVSYMHVLRLFYPLFVSIGILVFAYFFEPFLTTIVLFSILKNLF